MPYWNNKFKKDSDSIRRIPSYEKADDQVRSDKSYKKDLFDYEYVKTAKNNRELENYSGIDSALHSNDQYVGKKISEFIENALISQCNYLEEVHDNYGFGVNFNIPLEPNKIEAYKEIINIPD